MKQITLTLVTLIITSLSFGQENKTIKEVTTVKRVVEKKGSQVIVKEVEEVQKVKGAVMVANDESENQFFQEDTTKLKDQNILVDEVNTDKANEALIAAEKKRQEDELAKSKAEAAAKAEAERKILEAKKHEMEKQLEANRAKLQRRGKGVAKLKKKNKRGN